jgi:phage gp36-like protein
MAYITATDIENKIDQVNLNQMVDDYRQGNGLNSTQLANICQLASNAADALVASIYPTPFASPPPNKIYVAAIAFACEMLYQRRLVPDEKNPFKAEAEMHRDLLIKIGAGQLPLDESFTRGFKPLVISVSRNRLNTNMF